MIKLLILVAPIVVTTLTVPLVAAGVVTLMTGPAAGQVVAAVDCRPALAPDAAPPAPATAIAGPGAVTPEEGGIGFDLPAAREPRRASLTNPALSIPADVQDYYLAAAEAYQVPWTLLAGIGMEETGHGRTTATSTAGARGLMQFMPATFATMGVDGDGDGRADITNPADSVFSAANYLTQSDVTDGPGGVRDALWAYNHADWYVNDVLHYAHAYGGGTVLGDPVPCTTGGEGGNPNLPPLTDQRVTTVLAWAQTNIGEAYVFGANGPDAWDCSSFTQTAYAQIGITMPRTAATQRDWLAAGNGYRIPAGQERPGDLIFWDSYRGPNAIGHVVIVFDPATQTTIEANSTATGVGHFSYARAGGKSIFEIWRVGNLGDPDVFRE